MKESSNIGFTNRGHYQSQQTMQQICHIHKGFQHMALLTFFFNTIYPLPFLASCFVYVHLPDSFEVFPPHEASLVCRDPSLVSTSFQWLFSLNYTSLRKALCYYVRQGGRCSVQFQQDLLPIQLNCSHVHGCGVWQQCTHGDISSGLFFCKILMNYTCSLELNDFTHSISVNQD